MFKVRATGCCFIVLASLAGTATADMVPEDPYTDVAPTPVTDTTNSVTVNGVTVKGVPADVAGAHPSDAKPAPNSGSATSDVGSASTKPGAAGSASTKPIEVVSGTTSVSDGDQVEEWWEQQEVQIGGGVGFGLLCLGLVIRSRRASRRRRIALETRRTQFGMSAVDPTLAKINVAAWECGPAILPTAIEPEMVNGRRPRRAREPFLEPMAGPRSSSETTGVPPFAVAPVAQQFAADPFMSPVGSRDEIPPGARPRVASPCSQPVAPGARPSVPGATVQPLAAQPFVAAPSSRPSVSVAQHAASSRASVPAAEPFVAPSLRPFVPGPQFVAALGSQPVFAPVSHPYPHYSEADLAAYGMRPSQPQMPTSRPAVTAPQGSWHPSAASHAPGAPLHAPALQAFATQTPPRHHAPALHAFRAPTAPPAPTPANVRRGARFADGTPQPPIANPQPFMAMPQAPAPQPFTSPQPFMAMPQAPAPQPFKAMPQAHAPQPFAPRAARPSTSPVATTHGGLPRMPQALLPTHGASSRPPQASGALPSLPSHAAPTIAPHLARTQFATQHEAESTTHYTPAPLPPAPRPRPPLPSFVLEQSSTELPQRPAPYPLTFPAFPEAAGATKLAPIEPSGLNYWGPSSSELEPQGDYEPQLARGSQPVEHLDPMRVCLPHASPEDETRIAPAPQQLDKRTFDMRSRTPHRT